jgi:hypothetical protein
VQGKVSGDLSVATLNHRIGITGLLSIAVSQEVGCSSNTAISSPRASFVASDDNIDVNFDTTSVNTYLGFTVKLAKKPTFHH